MQYLVSLLLLCAAVNYVSAEKSHANAHAHPRRQVLNKRIEAICPTPTETVTVYVQTAVYTELVAINTLIVPFQNVDITLVLTSTTTNGGSLSTGVFTSTTTNSGSLSTAVVTSTTTDGGSPSTGGPPGGSTIGTTLTSGGGANTPSVPITSATPVSGQSSTSISNTGPGASSTISTSGAAASPPVNVSSPSASTSANSVVTTSSPIVGVGSSTFTSSASTGTGGTSTVTTGVAASSSTQALAAPTFGLQRAGNVPLDRKRSPVRAIAVPQDVFQDVYLDPNSNIPYFDTGAGPSLDTIQFFTFSGTSLVTADGSLRFMVNGNGASASFQTYLWEFWPSVTAANAAVTAGAPGNYTEPICTSPDGVLLSCSVLGANQMQFQYTSPGQMYLGVPGAQGGFQSQTVIIVPPSAMTTTSGASTGTTTTSSSLSTTQGSGISSVTASTTSGSSTGSSTDTTQSTPSGTTSVLQATSTTGPSTSSSTATTQSTTSGTTSVLQTTSTGF